MFDDFSIYPYTEDQLLRTVQTKRTTKTVSLRTYTSPGEEPFLINSPKL
jgi:hypothetical protein